MFATLRQTSALLLLTLAACAAEQPAEDGRDDAFQTGGKADTDGIEDGSPRALAVLEVANTLSIEALGAAPPLGVGLASHATDNLSYFRLGDDGIPGTADDGRFHTLAELDAIPFIGPIAFTQLLDYAVANGYVNKYCTDTTPFTYVNETLTSQTDANGPSIHVDVEATDDASGVDAIGFMLTSPNGTLMGAMPVGPQFLTYYSTTRDPASGHFTADVSLTPFAVPGTYTLAVLGGWDKAGNISFQGATAQTVIVQPGVVDVTPPTLGGVTATVLDASNGQVRVDLDVTDDLSGVDEVYFFMLSPSLATLGDRPIGPSDTFMYKATYDANLQRYSTVVTLGPNVAAGTYQVNTVAVVDRVGNQATLAGNAEFTIAPIFPLDTTPPTLQGATMTAVDGPSGPAIQVVLQVADDISGPAQVGVELQTSPTPRPYFIGSRPAGVGLITEFPATYDQATNTYRAIVPIPPDTNASTITLAEVAVVDRAGNYSSTGLGATALGFDISTVHVDVASTCQ